MLEDVREQQKQAFKKERDRDRMLEHSHHLLEKRLVELCTIHEAPRRFIGQFNYLSFVGHLNGAGTKCEPEAPVEDDDEDRVDEQINNALIILGLSALPSTVAEVNAEARTVLKASHPDHNFNSSASVERIQKILDARTLLRKHLGRAA